jgi:hypothetical protein
MPSRKPLIITAQQPTAFADVETPRTANVNSYME